MKTRLLFLIALLVLTAAVVVLVPRAETPAEPETAETEPAALPADYCTGNDFTFKEYRTETNESGLAVTLGEIRALSEYAGKPAVVTFWASWNAPSREQLAVLAALAGDDGFAVLPVNVGKAGKDSEKKAGAALAEKELTLPLLIDQTGVLRYNVTSTPRTLVFDAKGNIAADLSGLHGAEEIREAVDDARNAEEEDRP